jgi:hypothetical protein
MKKEYLADHHGEGSACIDWGKVFKNGQVAFLNFGDDMRVSLKEALAKYLQNQKVLSQSMAGNHEIVQRRSRVSLNPMSDNKTLYFTGKDQAGEYMAARLWGFPCEAEIITHGD